MLLPVVMAFGLAFRNAASAEAKPPLLPGFLVGFVLLSAANSSGWATSTTGALMRDVSR